MSSLTVEWSAEWPLPEVAVGLLVALGALRFLVADGNQGRVRAGLFFAGAHLVMIGVIGLVRSPMAGGAPSLHHSILRILSMLLFCFAAVITAGLLVFDVLLARRPLPRILRDLIQGVAYLVAALAVLTKADVEVSKIFTASVLTTAVIGLALQETLGNVMAGLALQIERDFEVGDWIRIDDKITGRIVEVRWRVTGLVTKNGDLLLVPNGVLARAVMTNFSRPTAAHRQWIYLRIHFRHPPAHVRDIITEAVRGVSSVRKEPAPDCILWEFKDDALSYAVRYWIDQFARDDSIDGEVRAMIWYAMHRAGMEIPFPSRNIHVTEMDEDRAQRKLDEDYARRVDALSRVDVFRALDGSHIDRLARRLRLMIFGPGEIVLRQGDPGDSLYVLRGGKVAVCLEGPGTKTEIAELTEGQFFGEMSLMTGESRTATIVAKTDVECYVVAKEAFQEIIETKPELAGTISEILSRRQGALAHISNRVSPSPVQAKKELLSRIASFFGIRPNERSQ